MPVHKNENQVNRLIKHLSKDFDVYVHVDNRSSINIIKKDNVFVFKKYNTYWGSFNIVLSTLLLLKEAHRRGYDRYILTSGQDLPVKTNEEIKAFFENNDSEYIDMIKIPREDGWPGMERLAHYHLDSKYHGQDDIIKYKILHRIGRKLFFLYSKCFPRKLDYDFYAGPQWFNFTHNCVNKIFDYLASDKNYIERYKWTLISDEIFFPTLIHLFEGIKIEKNCLRYVDWDSVRQHPRTLQMEDYEKIMHSDALFARKFDEEIDKDIIDRIYKIISRSNISY